MGAEGHCEAQVDVLPFMELDSLKTLEVHIMEYQQMPSVSCDTQVSEKLFKWNRKTLMTF